jgi:hypothetical protein
VDLPGIGGKASGQLDSCDTCAPDVSTAVVGGLCDHLVRGRVAGRIEGGEGEGKGGVCRCVLARSYE